MPTVKISIALCTYNSARWLPVLLESLKRQRRQPDELVVCDDGSSDNTLEVLRAFSAHVEWPVRIEQNDRNLGYTKNFEKAIGLCSGDAIFLCDHDDRWHEQKIEKMANALAEEPTIGLIFCDAELVDKDLKPLGVRAWDRTEFNNGDRAAFERNDTLSVLLRKMVSPGMTMAFRSRYRHWILPVPKEWVHDGWILFLVAAMSKVKALPEALVDYRIHGEQNIGMAPSRWLALAQRAHRMLGRSLSRNSAVAREMALLEERLLEISANRGIHPGFVEGVRARKEHFSRRGKLPRLAPLRLFTVARELADGNYQRFENGVVSALKDLISRK